MFKIEQKILVWELKPLMVGKKKQLCVTHAKTVYLRAPSAYVLPL